MLRFSRICVCGLLLWGGAEVVVAQDDDPLIGKKAGDSREIKLPSSGGRMHMRWCPPGTFTMGSPASETGRSEDEDDTAGVGGKPVEVTLTKGFWMSETETTQGQYKGVTGAKDGFEPWAGQADTTDDFKEGWGLPASFIGHSQAEGFCEMLTEIERKAERLPAGWKYALPTEAQWEYACRAGTTTKYSFGDDESRLGNYAWFYENAFEVNELYAHAVWSRKANPWGLSDMHGNLCEWCRDGYEDRLIGGDDPLNNSTVVNRVSRGGFWLNGAKFIRSASRSGYKPDYQNKVAGFRVVLTQ